MKATKKAVSSAMSVELKSFHDETMESVRRIEDAATGVEEGRKAIMQSLYAHYGNAIAPASKGGLSGNAMRTEDSAKAEASRLDLAVGAARELHGIIKAINEVRANVWQDYQRAFFGRNEKASVPKDEPENIKALRVEKAEHEQNAKVNKAEAKMADARAMLADTDEEKEREKKLAKEARALAKYQEEQAKDCAARIKEEAESNAGADAYGTLYAAIKALHDKYVSHKDIETSDLAKALITLL